MGLSDIPGMPEVRADKAVIGALATIILIVAVVVAITKPGHLGEKASGARVLVPSTTSMPPNGSYPGPVGHGSTATSTATTTTLPVAANQVRANGSLIGVGLVGANFTVPLPFTVSSPTRGDGNGATITNALIAGKRSSIAWDAGQPLPFSGNGAIVLTNVSLLGDLRGVQPQLGGHTFSLAPGTYHLGSDVAVSSGSLAAPQDAADFTADAKTTVTFQGQASLVATYPLHIEGPGQVTLDGSLQASTPSGTRSVLELRLARGPYTLDLAPTTGTVLVSGLFQGTVTTCVKPTTSLVCDVVTGTRTR
jgi:hypothetical protein